MRSHGYNLFEIYREYVVDWFNEDIAAFWQLVSVYDCTQHYHNVNVCIYYEYLKSWIHKHKNKLEVLSFYLNV